MFIYLFIEVVVSFYKKIWKVFETSMKAMFLKQTIFFINKVCAYILST